MMIVLYDLPASPPCRAVKMTANLLGIQLKIENVDLFGNAQHRPEFLKMNPFHMVPVIDDNGFILCESRAIMLYLINKYAPDSALYPKDPQKRAQVDQWLNIDNGTIFPAAANVLRTILTTGADPPPAILTKAEDALTALDSAISTRTYMVGEDFSLADISVVTSLSEFEMASYDTSGYTNIVKYISRIREKLMPMYAEVNDQAVAGLKSIVTEAKNK